jgi:hypothetical protein
MFDFTTSLEHGIPFVVSLGVSFSDSRYLTFVEAKVSRWEGRGVEINHWTTQEDKQKNGKRLLKVGPRPP